MYVRGRRVEEGGESREELLGKIDALRQRVEELKALLQNKSIVEEERDLALSYLDNAALMILVIDRAQKIRYINKKGSEILEKPREEILGKNWFQEFVPLRIRENIREVFNKLIAGEVDPVEYFDNLIVTATGEERIVAWHNTVLRDPEGSIGGTFSLGEDVTLRRREDAEKEDLIRKLRDQIVEIKTMKVMIPVCALKKDNMTDAIRDHYERIARDGKCSECVKAIR